MKVAAVAVGLALILLVSAQYISSDVPLLIWSGSPVTTGSNQEVSQLLDQADVSTLLRSFVSDNSLLYPFSKYLTSTKGYEAIIVFLEPKLRTDELSTYPSSFSTLRQYLKSKSSLTAPFVNFKESLDNEIVDIVSSASINGISTTYAGMGSALLQQINSKTQIQIVKIKELEEHLENSDIFSNGKTDLLIVHLDQSFDTQKEKFDQSNSIIESTITLAEKQTSKYIAFYTALSYNPTGKDFPQHRQYSAKRAVFDFFDFEAINDSNMSNITNNTNFFFEYFGGWFWELLVLSLIAVPVLVAGIYAIEGIQSPDRFPKPKQH